MTARAAGLAVALALAGCADVPVDTPDPAAVPSGSLQPQGFDATGPIVEIGSGMALDRGWRYAIYPSANGWCTQVETSAVVSTHCGDLLPPPDGAFGDVAPAELAGIHAVEGLVAAGTATVWMIGEGGVRAPATLMSLEPAGLDAKAFVGFAPQGISLTHVMAVAANGDVLETRELP